MTIDWNKTQQAGTDVQDTPERLMLRVITACEAMQLSVSPRLDEFARDQKAAFAMLGEQLGKISEAIHQGCEENTERIVKLELSDSERVTRDKLIDAQLADITARLYALEQRGKDREK